MKDELRRLIDKIKVLTDKNQEEIATDMGYKKNYISEILAPKGVVSKKFVTALKLRFSDVIIPEKDQPENDNENDYIKIRRNKKNSESKPDTLMFYEIGANASTLQSGEILPVRKNEGSLRISELFRGSEYAIRISGNSMVPSYPAGAIIGIREIHDKLITPGSVYVIEKDSDLWIKRLFYKNDDQSTGSFDCTSDNGMKYETGPNAGRYCYPTFQIAIDSVRRLFKVTGIYKPNELTVIQ